MLQAGGTSFAKIPKLGTVLTSGDLGVGQAKNPAGLRGLTQELHKAGIYLFGQLPTPIR